MTAMTVLDCFWKQLLIIKTKQLLPIPQLTRNFLIVLKLTNFKRYETVYILLQYVFTIVCEPQADVAYAETCRSVT
jgi:hypothetical protein